MRTIKTYFKGAPFYIASPLIGMYGPPQSCKRKTKDGSWSAPMYSALSGVSDSGPCPLAFVLINWTAWMRPFPISGFESVGETHCHLYFPPADLAGTLFSKQGF